MVVVNSNSAASVQVGNYYCEKRQVPPQNLLRTGWAGGNIAWQKADFQAVILGSGNPQLEEDARALQNDLPTRIRAETRFDAQLARQIYAGADMLLVPSRYEPCGLAQMIAMRYGCVPVVRAAGGLRDTVTSETGFIFEKAHVQSVSAGIRTALHYTIKCSLG